MGQDLQGIISHLHAQWVISPCIRAPAPFMSVVSFRVRAHGITGLTSILVGIFDADITFRAFEPRKDALTFYPFQILPTYRTNLYNYPSGYSTMDDGRGSLVPGVPWF